MTLADHHRVIALWRLAGLSEEPEDSEPAMAAFLAAPRSAGFVAEHADRIVGAVLCGTDGRYGYVHHLAVAPDRRQSGIGRSLMQACAEHLGPAAIVILVRDTNVDALGFWARQGFARVDGLGVHYVRGADGNRPHPLERREISVTLPGE